MIVVPSKYYLELDDEEAKKRYNEKLIYIKATEDPYCLLENPSSITSNCVEWSQWPDVLYADIYNYLILTPSTYTHEQLKAYKSLDGYIISLSG